MSKENQYKPQSITVCSNHKNYLTPLISTMAFRGAELWCPYCGYTADFMAGEDAPCTEQLQSRKLAYKAKYADYLHAHGVTYASYTEWEGKPIEPVNLPQAEKDRLADLRKNGWKEGFEIEA